MGEIVEDGPKPKRVSIPKTLDPENLPLETALGLIALPRDLGQHPDTGNKVKAGIGRFGPYVLHNKVYKSLTKDDDVLTVELDRAVELLSQARSRQAATPIRELGKHPDDDEPINIFDGRYGPYVKHGKVNATIPTGIEVDQVLIEEAIAWLEVKAAKMGAKKKKKKAPKKKAAKKKAPKKKTAKKATKKKAAEKETEASSSD